MAWLNWIACALGVWAIIAPFVFPWDVCPAVYGANIVPGLAVAVLAGWAGVTAQQA